MAPCSDPQADLPKRPQLQRAMCKPRGSSQLSRQARGARPGVTAVNTPPMSRTAARAPTANGSTNDGGDVGSLPASSTQVPYSVPYRARRTRITAPIPALIKLQIRPRMPITFPHEQSDRASLTSTNGARPDKWLRAMSCREQLRVGRSHNPVASRATSSELPPRVGRSPHGRAAPSFTRQWAGALSMRV